MKLGSILLSIIGLLIGLWASYLWWAASRIEIEPDWAPEDGLVATVVISNATTKAFARASELNSRAAAFRYGALHYYWVPVPENG